MELSTVLRTLFRGPSPRRPASRSSSEQALVDAAEEQLGRKLLALDGGLGLFRLVHLVDAFAKCVAARSVLSVGSGGGLHEAFLALRHPGVSICGIDLRSPYAEVDLPNLRFLQGDVLQPAFAASLPKADFVYSIECLEHIQEDTGVFARMAELVEPGGSLYLEVPFASPSEQADPEIRDREWKNHEHVRPGYSAQQLEGLARDHGLTDIEVQGAFWFPVQPMVWLAHQQLGAEAIAPHWRTLLAVAQLDLKRGQPASRTEATAIKLFARRPR